MAALSTKLSTAALDKHPQSKERGITLDLGFSAFVTDLPPQLQGSPYKALQASVPAACLAPAARQCTRRVHLCR